MNEGEDGLLEILCLAMEDCWLLYAKLGLYCGGSVSVAEGEESPEAELKVNGEEGLSRAAEGYWPDGGSATVLWARIFAARGTDAGKTVGRPEIHHLRRLVPACLGMERLG